MYATVLLLRSPEQQASGQVSIDNPSDSMRPDFTYKWLVASEKNLSRR
jgi:hypothetical protein